MPSPREVTTVIRNFLSSAQQYEPENLRDAAVSYNEFCRQANDRLRRCAEYLQLGLRSEAIYHAEVKPDVLNFVSALDLPQIAQWQDFCRRNRLDIPPALLYDTAKHINEAYNTERAMERDLKLHRALALARAPLKARLKVLRSLREADPHNVIWEEDIKAYETARLDELMVEAKNAAEAGRLGKLQAIERELTDSKWLADVSKARIDAVRKAARRVQVDRAVSELETLRDGLDEAYIAMSFDECSALVDEWTRVIEANALSVPAELQTQVQPIIDWVMAQRAEQAAEAAFVQVCAQLEHDLDDNPTMAELGKQYRAVKAFDRAIPEDLERRHHTKMKELVLAQSRRTRAIMLWSAPVVLAVAIGVFMLIQHGIRGRQVEQYCQNMVMLIEAVKLDEAEQMRSRFVEEHAPMTAWEEVQGVHSRLDEAVAAEQTRREAFEASVERIRGALSELREETTLPGITRGRQMFDDADRLKRTSEEELGLLDLEKELDGIVHRWQEKNSEEFKSKLDALNIDITNVDAGLIETDLDAYCDTAATFRVRFDGLVLEYRDIVLKDAMALASLPEGRVGQMERACQGKREEQERLVQEQRYIEGLLDHVGSAKTLAAKLSEFTARFPDSTLRAAAFQEAAAQADAWAAVQAWEQMIRSWNGQLLPKSATEIPARLQKLQEYVNNHAAASPLQGKPLNDYVSYMTQAQSAIDPAGPWRGELSAVMNEPVIKDLICVKTKDGKTYYARQDSKPRISSEGITVAVLRSKNIAEKKDRERILIKNPVSNTADPSPQAVLSQAVLKKLVDLDASNWDTFGLEIAQLVLESQELDAVLRATLLSMVLAHFDDTGWGGQEDIQRTKKVLSMWELDDVNWIDPDNAKAATLRSQIEKELKQLKPISALIRQAEKQRQAMLDAVQLNCVGYGLAVKDHNAWEIKAKDPLLTRTNGHRALVVARGMDGQTVELREIGVVQDTKLTIASTKLAGVPEGSLVFVCKSKTP